MKTLALFIVSILFKLIFLLQCEGIVEDMDEHFLELLADEANSPTLAQRICVEEGEYCKSVKEEL